MANEKIANPTSRGQKRTPLNEYKALELLLIGLTSATLLPPNLRATVLATQISLEVAGRRIQPDALVEFTVANSAINRSKR
jgi:hypothetical protein